MPISKDIWKKALRLSPQNLPERRLRNLILGKNLVNKRTLCYMCLLVIWYTISMYKYPVKANTIYVPEYEKLHYKRQGSTLYFL